MKVLNINSELTFSRYFNSFEWIEDFARNNIDSKILLLSDPNNYQLDSVLNPNILWNKGVRKTIKNIILSYEKRRGLQNKLIFWNRNILKNPIFLDSEIIHLHLIQGGFLDWKTLKKIVKLKPTIWTWHDPWPLTGHCVYPGECASFEKNCKNCPDLFRNFEIYRDRAFLNRLEKYTLLAELPIQIHLASNWMKNLIIKSGLKLRYEPKVIPLPTKFDSNNKFEISSEFRKRLKIDKESLIIGFRDTKQFQKNSIMIQRLLIDLPVTAKVVFVSVDGKGLLNQFKDKFKIIELGYLKNAHQLNNFYKSIDLFLNLSLDEAYGMMAAESLSCGTPVITKNGTATEEFINESNGFVIKSQFELNNVIENLSNSKTTLNAKLLENKEMSQVFDIDTFAKSMFEVYELIFNRFKNE